MPCVEKAINEIGNKIKNIKIEVTMKNEEIEYRNTGRKIGATFNGYKLESEMVVFVNIYDAEEWAEERLLLFLIAHEVGHGIFRADQGVRYDFMERSYEMPAEMWEYVVENYGPESWVEELFADGFAAAVTGITLWGDAKKEPGIVHEIAGIEKWMWIR